MNSKQWNSTAGAFCDGVCDDTPHMAFHSTVYALAFGAASDTHLNDAWEYVRSRSTLSPTTTHQSSAAEEPVAQTTFSGMPCGVYPAQFVLTALYQKFEDNGAAAFDILTSDAKNTWLAMLKKGATMTMEMWSEDEKPNLTWSHPWASSPAFIIAWYTFGIRPLEPGFAKVAIKPQVGALTSGRYTLPTVLGPITVRFRKSDTSFALHVSLPASSVGVVSIPMLAADRGAAASALRVDGSLVVAASAERGFAVVTVSGGAHYISVGL